MSFVVISFITVNWSSGTHREPEHLNDIWYLNFSCVRISKIKYQVFKCFATLSLWGKTFTTKKVTGNNHDKKCIHKGITKKDENKKKDKTIPQEQISDRICERSEVIEVPTIASQESVEVVKKFASGANFWAELGRRSAQDFCVRKVSRSSKISLRSEFLNRWARRAGLSKCPRPCARVPRYSKVSLTSEISERMFEQSEDIDVTKIPSQGPSLLRMVEQMIDVTKIWDLQEEEGWQRTVKQFLDDTRHAPVSRISASIRELRRVLSLFEKIREKKESRWVQWRAWEVSDQGGGSRQGP